jgi:uncharacterized protein (TIGR03437 family)
VLLARGKVGKLVKILENDLSSITSVAFNGAAAAFTVISDTQMEATVPAGATTGAVEVTTPRGPLESNAAFRVIP